MKRVLRLTPTLLLLLLAAAPATADQIAAHQGTDPRAVVSHAELLESQRANLLEYVRTHRPEWLRTRGFTGAGATEVMVYVDGNRMGGPAALQTIPTTRVAEVRYLDGREASTRWGSGHSSGAIIIRTGSIPRAAAPRATALAASPACRSCKADRAGRRRLRRSAPRGSPPALPQLDSSTQS